MACNTFLIRGCLAFLARDVYIGWAGSLLNIYLQMLLSFNPCLYQSLGDLFTVVEWRKDQQ
jgi:hypothetical protein